MIEDIHHHLFHYLVLIMILIGGLVAFFSFRYQPNTQLLIAISMGFSYVLWGIGHHAIVERRVHPRVVIEYVLIAIIGFLLIWGVLKL